jgi:hypothetical protein
LARNYLAKLEAGTHSHEHSHLVPEPVAKFPAPPEAVSDDPLAAASDRTNDLRGALNQAAEVAP